MLRRLLPALLALTLVLAACGSSEETTATSASNGCPTSKLVDSMKVTGAKDKKPTIKFDQPLKATTTSCKVLVKGSGAKVKDGSTAIFDYVFLNGRDGKEISSSYGQTPAEIVFDKKLMAGVHRALDGVAAGSRVLVAISPADGFGKQGDPQSGLKADDTLVFVLDLHSVRTPLARAKGAAVAPVAGLPTVVLAKDGAPTIKVPAADPPAELVAQQLIAGKGAVVKSGQTITVHYTGVLWATGEVFDSSWKTGTPTSFPIGTGGVIPGWDKGLVGQKVGSQVLLVIPPADGYPEGSGSIPAGATHVFVVDILDAHA
jgi:peptidylprolyl isomerase